MVDESVENAMRLNLRSRIAQRVLWPMVDGDYRDEHDLYDLGRRINWSEWITPDETIRVDVTAQRSPLQSLNFAALRIKDAVCDVMRDMAGARPSVDTRFPDLAISLHVDPTHAWIAIDLCGEALFKRGWREQQGEAPLKETLASTLIYAAGWQGRPEDGGLLDPCCGAGTIAIEAAQIACNVAPGLTRRFAFERLRPFLEYAKRWGEMQVEARDTIVKPAVPIWAGDVSFRMTDFATRNAERAGVAHAIEFKTADALQRLAPADRGTIVMNPPYGERIDAKGRGSQAAEAPRAPRTFAARARRTARRASARAARARTRSRARTRTPRVAARATRRVERRPRVGRSSRRRRGQRQRVLRAAGHALEAPLQRLDGLGAEPRHEAAHRDAPEGKPPRADVERPDRVPAVPLRHGQRLGARRCTAGAARVTERLPPSGSRKAVAPDPVNGWSSEIVFGCSLASSKRPPRKGNSMSFKLSTPLLAALALAASFTALSAHAADLPGSPRAYLARSSTVMYSWPLDSPPSPTKWSQTR